MVGTSTSGVSCIGMRCSAIEPNSATSVPAAQSTNEDTALVFSTGNGNRITISDVDAGASPMRVTLTASNGTITLNGTGGLTFSSGDGTADASMTFTGARATIDARMNGM